MGIQDDAVGYFACFVACVFFGSNFVPVKRVPTGDGMFFSLVMTSAVLLDGCVVQLWRGNPKFEPFAMLGGVIWATGNITVVPIVKSIGLGLGLLVWGLVGMLVGWASGHFGILGVEPDPPLAAPGLNYLGVLLAAASLGVYANITSEVAEGVDAAPREDDDPATPGSGSSAGGEGPYSYATDEPEPESFGSTHSVPSEREALLDTSHEPREATAGPRWVRKARDTPRGRFTFGFTLAALAGVLYGVNFNPPQRLMDEGARGADHSVDGLDYVFSHFCGIFLATSAYFGAYVAFKRRRGAAPQLPACVGPALASGAMWGVAQICWFVANERLSFSVSFPIITSVPGLVGALWGVLVFGEIKGRGNIALLLASGAMRVVAVALIALSKDGAT